MADIICPACGKTNPEELEICQYCGTLLKNRGTEPLAPIHPGEAPTPKKTSELERTLPTWLRDIRKGETSQNSKAGEAAAAENPAPSLNAPQAAKPEPPKKKDESPLDLLAGLAQSSEEEEEVPDWLASLKTNLPGGSVPSPEPAVPPAEQTQQPADWLAGLQDDSQPGQPAINWGAGNEPVSSDNTDEPAAPVAGETPDWLSSLQAQDENDKMSPLRHDDAPAQPAAMESSSAEDIPSTGSLPDWLNSLGNDSPQPAAPVSPVSEPPAVSPETPSLGDISGWLSGLDNEMPAAAATPSEPTPGEAAPAGDLPDWLAGLGSDSAPPMRAAPAVESPAENIPAPAIETPPGADTPPAATVAPSGDTPSSSSGDLPDWLAAAMAGKAPETPPADSNQSKAFDTDALQELGTLGGTGGLPDWMAGFGASAAAFPAASSEPESASAKPVEPAGQAPFPQDEPGPATPAVSPPDAAESQEKPVEAEPQTPALIPAPENDQNLDSILPMDMPDWLSGFTPTESGPANTGEQQVSVSPFNTDISPANLPSWVQAMRPMEAVISGVEGGEEDQNVEKEGPLAGLHSVLPGQTGPLGTHKPSAYSIKLQVDATQQAQAALLENLIASEAESQPVVTPKRVLTIRPLRWVIAAVLLLAVLVPALIPTDMLPGIFPAPFVDPNDQISLFRQKIDALPDAAVVLVVFDYQPGYAGEMEQAAGPVVGHLINKNARLAFVSSSPMGVLMSERMMAQYKDYQVNENYVDLGYVPGSDAGIQVFANNPKDTLGNDLIQGNMWASNALKGLIPKDGKIQLSSFAALIVLTDNPDTGRMWIEQTGQALQGKPLLMVISAQAEPMIRPYVAAGQAQGLVSGLAGGITYQQIPNSYWASYGGGMIATELLIVIGGVWALIEHLRARRVEQQQEEDEA